MEGHFWSVVSKDGHGRWSDVRGRLRTFEKFDPASES